MPKTSTPKVKAMMARMTALHAEKQYRKFVMSANYVMKYWPGPCTNLKSVLAKNCVLPKVVGLTGGKTLSVMEIFDFTMRLIVANPPRPDQDFKAKGFIKAIRDFLPTGLYINPDWNNFKTRAKEANETKALEVIDAFEEWIVNYYNQIESQMLGLYMTVGEKSGAQYLKVLERRFRDHFAANLNVTSKTEMKAEVKEEVKATVDGSVNFNFNVADSGRSIPNAST